MKLHAMEFEVFLDNKRQPMKNFKAINDQIFFFNIILETSVQSFKKTYLLCASNSILQTI